jgi:hypothetical protein
MLYSTYSGGELNGRVVLVEHILTQVHRQVISVGVVGELGPGGTGKATVVVQQPDGRWRYANAEESARYDGELSKALPSVHPLRQWRRRFYISVWKEHPTYASDVQEALCKALILVRAVGGPYADVLDTEIGYTDGAHHKVFPDGQFVVALDWYALIRE